MHDEKSILKEGVDYFKSILFVDATGVDQEVDLSIPNLISDEINQSLCKPVSEDEVREAVFSLGAYKAPKPYGFQGFFLPKVLGCYQI